MTSQGQRFRRRALRRGYKVDEVDSFLDRVEATLAGEQSGAPVGAQEVHDVVFRVRFGGYDEWQVDLHLDRVERQLAEFEDRGGRVAEVRMQPEPMRAPEPMRGGPDPMRGPEPMRGGMAERTSPDRMSQAFSRGAPPTERLQMPRPDDRQFARDDQYGRDEQQYGRDEQYDQYARDPYAQEDRMQPQQMPQRPPMPAPDPYGRYEEPGYGQQPPQRQQQPPPGYETGGYDTGGYDQFEPGRHGKADMTAEIRMPDRDRGFNTGGIPQMGGPQMGGPQQQMGGPQMGGPQPQPGGGGSPELYRVDQLRRTFQPRRFGSGYDPVQVDRLFESILQAMSGRGPMPVPENELDTLQFGLVPGGYFEAEVDAALREVKDILLHRR
ncbi:DivIVA domain-containing protein [Actinoplanes sp. N902-109]|uniref:DivIVA domain-containing protein n=1 Tax=Actinoplanes sp. (strain N902-109) TaxID=649831 RepID=UPI000329670E|nr:DivIVA domain-containing protein [Actinoplanes sp. N902-109]AGL20357.1 diviva domain-containing protein [Actinoplanes sp. N902-109]